jgi:hypothetical protein
MTHASVPGFSSVQLRQLDNAIGKKPGQDAVAIE